MHGKHEGVREFNFVDRPSPTNVGVIGMGWVFRLDHVMDDSIIMSNIRCVMTVLNRQSHAANEILLNYFDVDSELTLLYNRLVSDRKVAEPVCTSIVDA